MLHLMCNINFTSDMIAGEPGVHRAEKGSGSRNRSLNFNPPQKRDNIGNVWWNIDIPIFLTLYPFFHFCCNKYGSPFVFFSYLPYIFQVYRYPKISSFFSLPTFLYLQLAGWVAFPTRWVVWTLPRMVSADTDRIVKWRWQRLVGDDDHPRRGGGGSSVASLFIVVAIGFCVLWKGSTYCFFPYLPCGSFKIYGFKSLSENENLTFCSWIMAMKVIPPRALGRELPSEMDFDDAFVRQVDR